MGLINDWFLLLPGDIQRQLSEFSGLIDLVIYNKWSELQLEFRILEFQKCLLSE